MTEFHLQQIEEVRKLQHEKELDVDNRMLRQRKEFIDQVAKLRQEHKQELLRIEEEHEKDIQRLLSLHQQQISSLEINRHSALDTISKERTDEVAYYREQLTFQQQEYNRKIATIQQLLKEETAKLTEVKTILSATMDTHRTELLAVRERFQIILRELEQKEVQHNQETNKLHEQLQLVRENYTLQAQSLKMESETELQTYQLRLAQLEGKHKAATTMVRELTETNNNLTSELGKLTKSYDSEKKSKEYFVSLVNQNRILKEENETLRNQIKLLQDEQDKLHSRVRNYSMEISKLDDLIYGSQNSPKFVSPIKKIRNSQHESEHKQRRNVNRYLVNS